MKASARLRNVASGVEWPDLAALALGVALLAAYLYNLTGWMIFDDEGEYLYQVWRMTLGEHPYADFLTPQLPVFLYAGRAVMALAGPSLLAMRLYSVLLAFASGALLFFAGRKHYGPLAGLLAMLLFLLHSDVFKETRIFRNEPLFLFLVTAGLVLATWSNSRHRRRNLAIGGAAFGLATLVKLFGLLPAGGVGLWLLWEWWRERRAFRAFIGDAVAFSAPLIVTVVVLAGAFSIQTPQFLDLVVGHHLAQGEETPSGQIVLDKLRLYGSYFSFYPLFLLLGVLSAAAGLIRNDARQRWAWQLATVLAFMLLSRQLGQRHFMFLLPALALLAGWLLAAAFQGQYRRWGQVAAGLALAAIIVPWLITNADRAGWRDRQTGRIVALIEENTRPGESILSDDIGLAYYAKRPTTYSGAALSHGAVTSGQITGELLIGEIIEDNVGMVIVDESLLTGNHIVFLRDYPRFHRFLERNFERSGPERRDFQELAIWTREGERPWAVDDVVEIEHEDGSLFGESMRLLGYTFAEEVVAPGDTLQLTLFWQAYSPADHYWSVFSHLVDEEGALVGQHDKVPYDGLYPPNRWWPGEIVDDDYTISVPADAPAGQLYVTLGMYDHLTGERLALRLADGSEAVDRQITLAQPVAVTAER